MDTNYQIGTTCADKENYTKELRINGGTIKILLVVKVLGSVVRTALELLFMQSGAYTTVHKLACA